MWIQNNQSLPANQYENINKLKESPEIINNLNKGRNLNNDKIEKVNVDQVIKEVEILLQKDPRLPRLTRGEIVELLENITHEDSETLKNQRGKKAIMLVMPYTPNSHSDDMEEFYTKPPITKIIDNTKDDMRKVEDFPSFRPLTSLKPLYDEENIIKINDLKAEQTEMKTFKHNPPLTTYKSTTVEKLIATTTERIEQLTQSTTKRPLRRKTTPKRRQSYRTTSTTPKSLSSLEPSTSTKIIETPKPRRRPPVTQRPLLIDEITYKPTQLNSRRRPTRLPQHHPNHKYPGEEKIVTSNEAIEIIQSPNLGNTESKKSNYGTKTTTKNADKPNETILESINIPENMKQIVKDLDMLMDEGSTKVHHIIPYPKDGQTTTTKTTIPTTSATTIIPDVSEMADNLSPDMRELLMSFGLIPNPNYKPEPFKKPEPSYRETAEITRDSYVSFKPLPANAPTRQEMDQFLAEFGLIGSNRDAKAIITNNKKNKNQLNFDAVPETHKHILKDVGFKTEEVDTKNENNVFKLNKQQNVNPEELDRLEKLLDMIKQLEKLNGNMTEENLKKVDMKQLNELVNTFNKPDSLDLKKAPNPINYDSGLTKNEVKRQQSTTTTSTTTTTEAPRNPSLADLEASFGGISETVSEATLPDTTTARRTGFYYLADWNSFFDIDNQKGKRVNLRFQPKVGDPRNFLSVTVP